MVDIPETLTRQPERPQKGSAEAPSFYARVVFSEGLTAADRASGLNDRVVTFERGAKPLVVGRRPADDERGLAIRHDAWASRRHSRLWRLDVAGEQALAIEDLGSRNGTFVDGRRLEGRAVVGVGSVLRIGSTVMVVGRAPLRARARIEEESSPPEGFDARSWSALELWERVTRAGPADAAVLILGELGTGKTRLARQLHRLSDNASGPFVSYNCSAIPPNLEEATLFGVVAGFIPGVKEKAGLLAQARKGTLFLDELGDLPMRVQAKLLDAFDSTERSYVPVGGSKRVSTDCRLITATNRDVYALARAGELRQDLLSRLVDATLTVPPLRERREDILAIFESALDRHAPGGARVETAELAEALLLAPWTENVRGLESLARRVGLGDPLTADTVREHAGRGAASAPSEAPAAAAGTVAPPWPPNPEELLGLLDRHGWSPKEAAEAVGKRRETLARLITKTFGEGSRQTVRRAYAVWQRSGRVPGPGQVDGLHALFVDDADNAALDGAREAWRAYGTYTPSAS